MPSCWIEVSRAALRHNYLGIADMVGPAARVLCVVKANAYGLGAGPVSLALQEAGASFFAVTRLDEALALRQAGLQAPILLLAPPSPEEAEAVIGHELTATIASLQEAMHLDVTARKLGKTVQCHLKINTGMNRFGVAPAEAAGLAKATWELPGVQLQGAYTHFPAAGSPDTSSVKQHFQKFSALLPELAPFTTEQLFHCANSAALVRFQEMRLAAVRPGTLLYGQFPGGTAQQAGQKAGLTLQDPFKVQARVVAVQKLKAGESVGYGQEWKAARPTTLAVLACGYADGLTLEPRARTQSPWGALKSGLEQAVRLSRNPQAGRTVSLRGRTVPLVGRIAMQTCTADVTGLENVQLGEIVTVPMRRVTSGAHLPRVYTD